MRNQILNANFYSPDGSGILFCPNYLRLERETQWQKRYSGQPDWLQIKKPNEMSGLNLI